MRMSRGQMDTVGIDAWIFHAPIFYLPSSLLLCMHCNAVVNNLGIYQADQTNNVIAGEGNR